MNVSLQWLSQHLDLSGFSLQQIDDLLTYAGIEVEGISSQGVPSEQIVVAQIREAVQHPDADRLKICQVDAGEGKLRQIVCGAKNYQVGDKVPCALPGAQLGHDFVIKEGKLRGVDSLGMLCSASEIGLTDGVDGLMILDPTAEIGTPLNALFPSDTIIEVEVTPNRPDLLSHYGMARELGALLNRPARPLDFPTLPHTEAANHVQLDSAGACPVYALTKIRGVKVAESPDWLKTRLLAIGLRPINNIVDVTNFVLHEMGHPLHAFDAAKIQGHIVIRQAEPGESLNALDGQVLQLQSDDLLIADSSGTPLALAGVMGGLDSSVTDQTTDIFLESAWFQPTGIRKSARRCNLSTDSSYRFERGADPQAVLPAAALATQWILELAGGTVEGPVLLAGEAPATNPPVTLDEKRLTQLMGDQLDLTEAKGILTKLGLKENEPQVWHIPSFRHDLKRHIDLVEEVARVYGLDRVPSRFQGSFVGNSASDHSYDYLFGVKQRLAAQGFYETQTIKLIAKQSLDGTIAQLVDALPLKPLQEGDIVEVSLPLSEDHAVLRPSLTPGLVAVACRNARQAAKSFRFFEAGRHFRHAGGGKARDLEADSLAILLAGELQPAHWTEKKPRHADLFDLKAIIEGLVPKGQIQFKTRDREPFLLAGDVLLDGKPLGVFAQLAPSRARELDLPKSTFLAELDLAKLEAANSGIDAVDSLPLFPSSSRDAAIEVPQSLTHADLTAALDKHREPLLVETFCFDLFSDPTGEKLASDKKSLAYRFLYRADDRTLKQEEVDQAHNAILQHLLKSLPIQFR